MSIDPAGYTRGAPFAPPPGAGPAGRGEDPQVRLVEVLRLAAGDRLVVHVDGAAGMSAGGAERIGQLIREKLALDGLTFDVPLIVVSPGIRVEVVRPG